jgi:hypothetical protein
MGLRSRHKTSVEEEIPYGSLSFSNISMRSRVTGLAESEWEETTPVTTGVNSLCGSLTGLGRDPS